MVLKKNSLTIEHDQVADLFLVARLILLRECLHQMSESPVGQER